MTLLKGEHGSIYNGIFCPWVNTPCFLHSKNCKICHFVLFVVVWEKLCLARFFYFAIKMFSRNHFYSEPSECNSVKKNAHVDTKMLASDWLLQIAVNQKPDFWCRQCRCGKDVGGLKKCWRTSTANQKPARHRRWIPGAKTTVYVGNTAKPCPK